MTGRFISELEVAIQAVATASVLCRNVQAAIATDAIEKKDKSPVTIADYVCQGIVSHLLHQAFPNDPLIGEEDVEELRQDSQKPYVDAALVEFAKLNLDWKADRNALLDSIARGGTAGFSSRFWTLDPVDGTKGFLRKEQYAISLALIVDGVIEVGVLGCPNLPEKGVDPILATGSKDPGVMLVAMRGGNGAYAIPLNDISQRHPIRVSSVTDPAQMKFCESVESGHSAHDHSATVAKTLGISATSIRLDSQAKYGVLARGEAEIYLRLPTRKGYKEKIWDHAGGVIVIEEAGGVVTDIDGKPLDFTHGRELLKNRGIVASNGPIHQQIIEIIPTLGLDD
ncbi:FIG domain-containing protein [Lacunimicrobium album]